MILNMIHNALSGIHADEELKSKTKEAVFKAVTQQGVRRRPRLVTIVSAAACAAVFAACAVGWNVYFTPVYALSIDINPSVELGINRFDRVVSVKGYNEDGERIAENSDIKNMSYTDAVDTLLSSDTVREYTDSGADVVVGVSGGDRQKNSEIVAAVENCHRGTGMHCYMISDEDAEAAHDCGLTPGKYLAYTELKKYDPSVTVEEIRDMPMREIRDRISSYIGEQYYPGMQNGKGGGTGDETNCGNNGAQNGSGRGYGHGQGHHGNHGNQ